MEDVADRWVEEFYDDVMVKLQKLGSEHRLKLWLKILEDLPLIVWDENQRTLKNVESVCRNGATIQLNTEIWTGE